MNIISKYTMMLALLFVMLGTSCKVEKVTPANESVKDISGSWKVVKLSRNGTDLTNANGMDLSNFRVVFQSDKTYKLENRLPFIVNTDGAFEFSDLYPLEIQFKPSGTGETPVKSTFNYPIVDGVRRMEIEFTANPGCDNNEYTYVLEKTN